MGMVWEAYHKGVPLLGVPGMTLDELWFGVVFFCFLFIPIIVIISGTAAAVAVADQCFYRAC